MENPKWCWEETRNLPSPLHHCPPTSVIEISKKYTCFTSDRQLRGKFRRLSWPIWSWCGRCGRWRKSAWVTAVWSLTYFYCILFHNRWFQCKHTFTLFGLLSRGNNEKSLEVMFRGWRVTKEDNWTLLWQTPSSKQGLEETLLPLFIGYLQSR